MTLEGLRTETVRYIRGRSRYLRDLVSERSAAVCCVCETDSKKVLNSLHKTSSGFCAGVRFFAPTKSYLSA